MYYYNLQMLCLILMVITKQIPADYAKEKLEIN